VENPSSGGTPRAKKSADERIADLRARVEAGDRNAPGPLGELLAGQGDLAGAIAVWDTAYGDEERLTKRLADLLVQEGELKDAVGVWEASYAVWTNPISLYRQGLAAMPEDERREFESDEPEEMAGTWTARLIELLVQKGEAAVIAQVRARRR
jgi:hypothetical protein